MAQSSKPEVVSLRESNAISETRAELEDQQANHAEAVSRGAFLWSRRRRACR